MYFKLPSLLISTGTSLIVSNSLWFNWGKLDNLNSYEEEEGSVSLTASSQIKTNYESKKQEENAGQIYFTLKESGSSGKEYKLYKPTWDLDSFNLEFPATIEDYKKVDISDISIYLFSNSAWNSSTHKDEYSSTKLTQEQLKELIPNPKDHKTKQLLLSLSKRRDWEYLGNISSPAPMTYWGKHSPSKPKSIEDLKDLKIKYFKDFESLKTYIQAKVKTCTTPKKACVAKAQELDFPEQDKLDFYVASTSS